MKIFALLSVLVTATLPTLAFANCSGEKLDIMAATCMPNMIWDAETQTCIENPST